MLNSIHDTWPVFSELKEDTISNIKKGMIFLWTVHLSLCSLPNLISLKLNSSKGTPTSLNIVIERIRKIGQRWDPDRK